MVYSPHSSRTNFLTILRCGLPVLCGQFISRLSSRKVRLLGRSSFQGPDPSRTTQSPGLSVDILTSRHLSPSDVPSSTKYLDTFQYVPELPGPFLMSKIRSSSPFDDFSEFYPYCTRETVHPLFDEGFSGSTSTKYPLNTVPSSFLY